MAGREEKRRWGWVLKCGVGVGLCLLTVVTMRAGLKWYWAVAVLGGYAIIIMGSRRNFAVGVTRTADAVTCRFVPWYEGNTYTLLIVLPLLGVAMVAAGYAPGNPVWLRFGGIILLGVTPLLAWGIVRNWRRSLLRITASMLTIRLPLLGGQLTDIARDAVESITPKRSPLRTAPRYRSRSPTTPPIRATPPKQ